MEINDVTHSEHYEGQIYEINGIRKIKSNKNDFYIITFNDNYNQFLINLNITNIKADFQIGNKIILTKTTSQRIPLKSTYKTITYIKSYKLIKDIPLFPDNDDNENEDFIDINADIPINNSSPPNQGNLTLSDLTQFTKEYKVLIKITKLSKPQVISNNNKIIHVLNFIIQDHQGTEMLVIANEDKCDYVYPFLKENAYYIITGVGGIYMLKSFNPTDLQYYISWKERTILKPINEPIIPFKEPKAMKLTTLDNIKYFSDNEFINVIGYVLYIYPNSKTHKFKTLKLSDLSNFSISCAFSQEFFHKQIQIGDVVLFKRCKLRKGEYKSICTCHLSDIIVNPNNTECIQLKEYFKNQNIHSLRQIGINTLNGKNPIYIRDFIHNYFSIAKPNDLFAFQGCLSFVGSYSKMTYCGCPLQKCFKRKVVIKNNSYYCNWCQQMFREVNHYYKMIIEIKDATQKINVMFFDEQGEKLIGMNGNKFHDLVLFEKEEQLKQIEDNIKLGEYIVYCRVKVTNTNNNNGKGNQDKSCFDASIVDVYVDSFTKINW